MSDKKGLRWEVGVGWTGFSEFWWKCDIDGCGKTLVNVSSGSTCPTGHGKIIPQQVPAALGAQPHKKTVGRKKYAGDVEQIVKGSLACAGKGKSIGGSAKCEEDAILMIGLVACCWDCCLSRDVDPRTVLGPDWREKLAR